MAVEGIEEMSIFSERLAIRHEGEEKAMDSLQCHLGDWQKNCTINHNEIEVVWVSKKQPREGTLLFIKITKAACLKFNLRILLTEVSRDA